MVDLVLELAGKRILVAGTGVAGRAVARALLAESAVVTTTGPATEQPQELADAGAIMAVELTEPPAGTDLVVTSPGWRPDSPLLVAAKRQGIEVIGDVELAWRWSARLASSPPWLVVTGTNGKTTTTGMLESILRAAGLDAIACGNIGLPLIDALVGKHEVLAVELSSFQLHWAPSIQPAAGVLLNLAPDHLDWHGGMEDYARAKSKVLTGAIAVAGVDDPVVAELLAKAPAARKIGITLAEPVNGQLGVSADCLVDRAFANGEIVAEVADVHPSGPAGLIDALAAAALARAYGVPSSAVAAGLRAFQPAPHRAQLVTEIANVRYVNDSKATNPHAVAAAFAGYDHVVWIAGGLLKGASVDDLVIQIADKLVGVVLIGADQDVIAEALARHAPNVPVRQLRSSDHNAMTAMSETVHVASKFARPGDVVLLAPAAASMDMFTNYQHRGNVFTEAVLALAERDTADAAQW